MLPGCGYFSLLMQVGVDILASRTIALIEKCCLLLMQKITTLLLNTIALSLALLLRWLLLVIEANPLDFGGRIVCARWWLLNLAAVLEELVKMTVGILLWSVG